MFSPFAVLFLSRLCRKAAHKVRGNWVGNAAMFRKSKHSVDLSLDITFPLNHAETKRTTFTAQNGRGEWERGKRSEEETRRERGAMLEIRCSSTCPAPSLPKGVLLHPCVDKIIKINEPTAVNIIQKLTTSPMQRYCYTF